MVRVNCAAIPPTLIESELFGREKGAFTGALARQIGRFEMADHSTIFLDEIGDLPLDVQVKLLRVLEERTIERLGSPQPIRVDVRIIAATHRDLERRIGEGAFREDLYYRLNVFPIPVPPLRERGEDIPLLVWRFVEEFSKGFGRRIDSIDKQTFAALAQYSWPGNIRELRNVIERAVMLADGPVIELGDLPDSVRGRTVTHAVRPLLSLPTVPSVTTSVELNGSDGMNDANRILTVLRKHNNNRCRAATELGMSRVSLYKKLHRYGLFVSKCKRRIEPLPAG